MTQASTNSTFTNSALSITGGAARTKLENALIETLAIDPTNFTEARQRMWINTADGHIKYTGNAGVTIKTVTNTDDGPPVLLSFSDNFNRTDNASSIGISSSGQAWNVVTGTWGISSNEGYVASDTPLSIITTPVLATSDYTISMKLRGDIASGVSFREFAIILKYIDSSNYLILNFVAGIIYLFDKASGAVGSSVSTPTESGVNYVLKAICNGNNIKGYVDDVLKLDITLSGGLATKYAPIKQAGVYFDKGGSPSIEARIDDFNVTTN